MALPFVSFVAATAASTGVSNMTSHASAPLTRAVDLFSNKRFPNVVASFDLLYRAWVYNKISNNNFALGARALGIALDLEHAEVSWREMAHQWSAVRAGMLPKPDAIQIYTGIIRGVFDKADETWLRGNTRIDVEFMQHSQDLYRQWWTVNDVMQLTNRQAIVGKDSIDAYRRAGGYTSGQIAGYEELRRIIPPMSELVRYTVKEAFNPAMVAELKLDAEIDEAMEARDWCDRLGLGQCVKWVNGNASTSIDWFDINWYAHWDHMAPGQLGDALARFRPGRLDRYREFVPDITPFTIKNYNTLMKANDYPPPERAWLAGLSLSLPRLIDVRKQYYLDIIDRKELIELQLDRNYTRIDAERFAKQADKEKEIYKYQHRVEQFDQFDRRYFNEVIEAFRVGSISEADFSGTISQIVRDQQAAAAVVASEIIRKQTQIVKASVAAIKSAFMTGEIPSAEAHNRLSQAGLAPEDVQRYVDLWELRLTMPRRVRTAAQLTGDFVHGFISITALSIRLQNLGYSERDTALALAEALRRQQIFKESEQKKEEKKRGKGEGGTVDAGERWLTPDRISRWRDNKQIPPEMADELMRQIDVAPRLIPLFYGEKLNG